MALNKRKIGSDYEERACEFLKKLGFMILERNFRNRTGEIDIIARDGRFISFIEVKYRSSLNTGFPSEAVNLRKQQKIINTSRYYLYTHHLSEAYVRYDVVEICGNETRIIKNAFGGGMI
ncbi:MAG: YraN family protein [Eubacteriales bacterium]|nr:YraN family protein [Eubacteriales bacterium]